MSQKIKILIVDDTEVITTLLKQQIINHYPDDTECLIALSGEKALDLFEKHDDIDILISDAEMPGMHGFELLATVKNRYPDVIRILISGYADFEGITNALNDCEISAFIQKPWSTVKLFITLDSIISRVQLRKENEKLHLELQESFDNLLLILKDIIMEMSPELASHSRNVSSLGRKIANELKLSEEQKRNVEFASSLYILGLLGISDEVYKTTTKNLSNELREVKHQYPELSASLLKSNKQLEEVSKIINVFHENIDGTGHKGVEGKDIPIESRILRLCNEYNSAILFRGKTKEHTLAQINRKVGTIYDKRCVKAFINILSREIGAIQIPIVFKELKAGMKLGKDLISKNNRKLLPKGTTITMLSLRKLLIYNMNDPIEEVFIIIDN